jgi:hypothetical protein
MKMLNSEIFDSSGKNVNMDAKPWYFNRGLFVRGDILPVDVDARLAAARGDVVLSPISVKVRYEGFAVDFGEFPSDPLAGFWIYVTPWNPNILPGIKKIWILIASPTDAYFSQFNRVNSVVKEVINLHTSIATIFDLDPHSKKCHVDHDLKELYDEYGGFDHHIVNNNGCFVADHISSVVSGSLIINLRLLSPLRQQPLHQPLHQPLLHQPLQHQPLKHQPLQQPELQLAVQSAETVIYPLFESFHRYLGWITLALQWVHSALYWIMCGLQRRPDQIY